MQIFLSDLAATQRLGSCLGACIDGCALVAMEGTLGAGKTTLVKAVAAELGVAETVVSPTFTMLNEYHSGRLPLYHLDIYRGGETGETMDLTMLAMEMEELLGAGGVAMVEWPQYFECDGRSFFDGRDFLHISLKYAVASMEDFRAKIFHTAEGPAAGASPAPSTRVGQAAKRLPVANDASQAVDNPCARETFERVLRGELPPEKYIKDGFTHSRIAILSANGPLSGEVLRKLSDKLGDMVINL